jgi:hypothetical protein
MRPYVIFLINKKHKVSLINSNNNEVINPRMGCHLVSVRGQLEWSG